MKEKTNTSQKHLSLSAKLVIHTSETLRIRARSYAVAVFLLTSLGFMLYPRPYGTHVSLQKPLAHLAVDIGGYHTLIALLICFAADCLSLWSTSFDRRPLSTAFVFVLAWCVLITVTPSN